MARGDGVRRFLASGGTRRQMIGTALAGLILGLGCVVVGTSLARANEQPGLFNIFERLFGGPAPERRVQPPPRPGRYANLPDARRIARPQPLLQTPRHAFDLRDARSRKRQRRRAVASLPPMAVAQGPSTVCVRTCDGYLFPLGRLASRNDLPVHEAACAAACPGAATNLYTLGANDAELDSAVSLKGQPYRASAFANVYRTRRVASCSCQAAPGTAPVTLAEDPTIRPGDVVTTRDSARIVTRVRAGSVATEDFRHARGVARARIRAIEARVGALRREEDARTFRRALRLAEGAGIVRVAAAGPGFQPVAAGNGGVRVVSPSPYLR
ncbi:DUF2865 domain-containing protein [Methylobacterium sp. A54F]